MATLLKNMKLTSVDLVGRGANQEAHISLFKGLGADPTAEARTEEPTASQAVSKADPDRFDRIEEFP